MTQETLDAAANRCIARVTQAVARRALQLKQTLELAAYSESESETRSDLASRWPRRRVFLTDYFSNSGRSRAFHRSEMSLGSKYLLRGSMLFPRIRLTRVRMLLRGGYCGMEWTGRLTVSKCGSVLHGKFTSGGASFVWARRFKPTGPNTAGRF